MLQVVEDMNSFQDQLGRDQAACSPLLEAIGDIKFKESVKYIEAVYKQLVQGKKYFIKWLSRAGGLWNQLTILDESNSPNYTGIFSWFYWKGFCNMKLAGLFQ